MSSRYLIPAAFHRAEDAIKRSRFIVSMDHAPDTDTAKAFVTRIKEEFPDATHNCWAFAAGPPGGTAHVGMSDDGEPNSTAGKPMLNTLLHSDVGEIAAVVTRYYGGTKLGTGGLVRAYSGMVQLGLESLTTKEKVDTTQIIATIPYQAVTLFKRMLPDYEVEVDDEVFSTDAQFHLTLPVEHLDTFSTQLAELTDGKANITQK